MSVVLLVALASLSVVVASEAVQQCIQDYKYHYANEPTRGALALLGFSLGATYRCLGRFTHENGEALIAVFTLGLVGVTAILAYYTFNLWSATKRLAEDAATAATAILINPANKIT